MKTICIHPDQTVAFPAMLRVIEEMATKLADPTHASAVTQCVPDAVVATVWNDYSVEQIAAYYAKAFGPPVHECDDGFPRTARRSFDPEHMAVCANCAMTLDERETLLRDYIHATLERAILKQAYETTPRRSTAALIVLNDRLAQLRDDARHVEDFFLREGASANADHRKTCKECAETLDLPRMSGKTHNAS